MAVNTKFAVSPRILSLRRRINAEKWLTKFIRENNRGDSQKIILK